MNLYNGWLIIDKPKGITSNDAVQKVKRLIGKENKVGHAGTLDPLAEGILPIAIGEATKTTGYLMDASKEYEFDIAWGEERSTGDAEGEVTATNDYVPSQEEIQKILSQFIGEIIQTPPIYSAIKIAGKPAYKLAREGKEVEIPTRIVKVYKLEVINHDVVVTRLRVNCGKGTYVRSLAVDIARALGSYGYVSYLRRTRVGKFLSDDAIMLAKLINIVHNTEIKNHLLPTNYGLGDILVWKVTDVQALALRQGKLIDLPEFNQASEMLLQIFHNEVLQAIACVNGGVCKPLRVFNLT